MTQSQQTNTLGVVTNVPMGEWSATAQYLKLNMVRSHNATYQAKKDNVGIEPTVSQGWKEVWQVVAYDGGVNPNGIYPDMTVGKAENDGLGNNIANQFDSVTSDIKGLREDINNESHFRGYLATNAEILALSGTPNDYAYSAESGTVWIYQTETGWTNSGKIVPDQSTPASNSIPLMDGIGAVGEANEYARGDHRHPSDTTKVSTTDNFPAEQIVLDSDLVLAGDYVQVGNVSKGSETATVTYPAKGKSVAQVLQEIFTKRLQPKILKYPSVSGFTFSMAGKSVEVGTHIDSIEIGTLNLNDGAYTYDTNTGVEASGYSISRVLNGTLTEISTEQTATDTNEGVGFTIGDNDSINYRGSINYTQGNIATDNLGNPSDPIVRIEEGTAVNSTLYPLTGYRNYFYGATSLNSPPKGTGISSEFIRTLVKSNRAYVAGTISVSVLQGSTGVYIACIATKTGVVRVFNENNQQDITAVFTKQQGVSVEGLNGYVGANYNVWFYVPAVPFENDTILTVTLG